MAPSYPQTFPSTARITKWTYIKDEATSVNTSPYSYQQQTYRYGGQRLRVDIELGTMTRAQGEEMVAFMHRMKGSFGTFTMGDPTVATARGNPVGTPLVKGASQTGEDLDTDGWTVSVATLLEGDYIQIGTGSGTTLFKVLSDATSDGSGNMTITIWPSLGGFGRASPANNATIIISSTVGLWRLVSNSFSWQTDGVGNYKNMRFSAVEAL